MKKLLKIFSFNLALLAIFSSFSFASDCIQRDLWDNSICVRIDKWNNNRYTLDSDIDCNDSSCAVSCSILLPDNTLANLWACNGKFYYNSSSSKKVKLYITINNDFATIESYYNFGNGSWGSNWWWSSSYDNDELKLSANKTNPSTSEWIKLTIETDDDYVWKVSFYKVQYRSSTSSSRSTISSRTNSTYFSDYSDEREQGYYKMKSSDDGEKTISNFLKFAKKGYYKIYAEDEDDGKTTITFNVWGSSPSTSSSYVEISTDDRYPSVSEYVDLEVDTDEDYVGKVYLTAKYRSSTSSSRSTISNTSSTYFSNRSTAWSNWYVSLTSSSNGHKDLSNAFKFAKKGYYRIIAEDEDWKTDYIDFNVWGSSSSTSSDELELSANKTNPSTSEWIKLTIETDDDYVWKVSFYKVQYRSSTSSSRSTISSRTNSTYFSDYSDEREQGYYKMKSSDDGEKTISNFLKFAKKGYYKIYAEDEDDGKTTITFNVWGSSSSTSSDELWLETDDDEPSLWEYVDLTVFADSSYRWKIYFSAKYKSSSSNSWTNISRTSSSYFTNRSTTWTNGYVTMTSSDDGEKSVNNVFKFAKKWYYRIYIEDEDEESTYLDFYVWVSNSSPLDGFTQKEFEMIERIYNVWPTLISKLRSEYPRIKSSSVWKNLSDELYENMWDVVNQRSNREFQDYDDFDDDFRYRFSYTQRLMD